MTNAAAYHQDISLEKIRIDGGTQPRAEIDTSVVSDYAEKFELGETFPNVDLFFDGKHYWLADGFHRYFGAEKAHMETIPATIHRGTQRDAVLFSVGANSTHGLRRTNEDKRHAVLTLLNDEEWGKKSQRWIAEKCGVSHRFVGMLCEELETVSSSTRPSTTIGRDGKERPATRQSQQPTEQEQDDAEDYAADRSRMETVTRWEQGASQLPTVSDHRDADAESDNLFTLKQTWKKSTKKDRTLFLAWTKEVK